MYISTPLFIGKYYTMEDPEEDWNSCDDPCDDVTHWIGSI
jgi:hypothetical protein